ncbi:unnamed protein product [Echinostoma caproni]|uniref:Uncharacterized protein n=1 Tax=Echinostoma caproni TaxID=27848 RepID=A0A183ALJ1_9TREM|nr:unnamed protein product [Echinostoma caproni]
MEEDVQSGTSDWNRPNDADDQSRQSYSVRSLRLLYRSPSLNELNTVRNVVISMNTEGGLVGECHKRHLFMDPVHSKRKKSTFNDSTSQESMRDRFRKSPRPSPSLVEESASYMNATPQTSAATAFPHLTAASFAAKAVTVRSTSTESAPSLSGAWSPEGGGKQMFPTMFKKQMIARYESAPISLDVKVSGSNCVVLKSFLIYSLTV